MFDPMSWLRFWKPLLRNRSVLVVTLVWLLSVAGSFTGPADAVIITTGDVDPGGAATQPDPWAVGGDLKVGYFGTGTLNVEAGGVVFNTEGVIGDYSSSTGIVTVTGTGSQWNNSHSLYVGFSGDGTLNVEAGGVVFNTEGVIGDYPSSTGIVTVTGTGSQWNNSGNLYVALSGNGTLIVEAGGLVTVSDTAKLWSKGTVNLDGGILDTGTLDLTEGTFSMLDGYLHADHVIGDLNNQGGTLAPGNSPRILTVTDDYTQGAAATLEIELGGTVRGDEHDAMIVNGDFTLDGSLDVLPIGGFVPQAGDLFDILDFAPANLSGSFNAVSLPALASDLEWDQANLYITGELLVSLSQLLGDFNQDSIIDADDIDLLRIAINTGSGDPIYDVNGGGLDEIDFDYEVQSIIGSAFGDADLNQQVNFTDFVSLTNNFGSTGAGWGQGNFNLDDITNFEDFVLLTNNYGADLSSGVSVQETVPEPASLVLLSLAVGFVAKRRRGIKYPISD